MPVGSAALGVVGDDLHAPGKFEIYVLDVLRRITAGAHEANEEVSTLALGTSDYQQPDIHGISPDVACACNLAGDTARYA